MKGLDRLSHVYRNFRRSTLFLFFIPLTAGVQAPGENAHQIAKCTCVPGANLKMANLGAEGSREIQVNVLPQETLDILNDLIEKPTGQYKI